MAIIDKPSNNFNTKLYTGNGGTQSITGVGFKPDWTWIKSRTTTGYQNVFDAVRGSTKRIFTNVNEAEQTVSNSLTAFNNDGFTVGSNGDVNGNSQSQVAWNWKAGGSVNGNTNGSITSTTSVNDTAGFSILTYTGSGSNATLGHGLSTALKMIIVKRRDGAANWQVYHGALAANQALELNGTGGSFTAANRWNSTAPTNTVFSVGTATEVNAQYGTYVAYCFAEKTNYSKFGSYIGTGSTNGPFIYTGFKPAFVLIKSASSAGSWLLWDNKRSSTGGFNSNHYILVPNNTEVEQTGTNYAIDILSNGFKLRNNNGNVQNSGENAIYMAFAENPFVTSTDNGSIPATAR